MITKLEGGVGGFGLSGRASVRSQAATFLTSSLLNFFLCFSLYISLYIYLSLYLIHFLSPSLPHCLSFFSFHSFYISSIFLLHLANSREHLQTIYKNNTKKYGKNYKSWGHNIDTDSDLSNTGKGAYLHYCDKIR